MKEERFEQQAIEEFAAHLPEKYSWDKHQVLYETLVRALGRALLVSSDQMLIVVGEEIFDSGEVKAGYFNFAAPTSVEELKDIQSAHFNYKTLVYGFPPDTPDSFLFSKIVEVFFEEVEKDLDGKVAENVVIGLVVCAMVRLQERGPEKFLKHLQTIEKFHQVPLILCTMFKYPTTSAVVVTLGCAGHFGSQLE